jgi:hypothetical protein
MLTALFALAALTAGSSHPPAAPASSSNRFAGSWAGTFTIAGVAEGETTLNIQPSGRVTGTVHNLTFGVTGRITGHVGRDGAFTLIALPEDPQVGVGIGCGVFEIAGNGHLVTAAWGVQETGCDNPGWSQDLAPQ